MPQRACSSPSICCPRPAAGRGLRLQAESLGPGAFSFCMAHGGDRKGHSLAVHVEEELLQRNRAPRGCTVIVPQEGGNKGVQRQEAQGNTRVSTRTGQVWGHLEGSALQVCNAAATSSRSPRLQPTRRHRRARGRSNLGRHHLGACENSKHGSCAHSKTAVSMSTCVGGVLRRHALATRLRVPHPEIPEAKIEQSPKTKMLLAGNNLRSS